MLTTSPYQEINTPFQKHDGIISYISALGTTSPFKGGAREIAMAGGCTYQSKKLVANSKIVFAPNSPRRGGMKVWRGCMGLMRGSFQISEPRRLDFFAFVKKKMKAKNGYGKQTEFILEGDHKLRGFYSGNFLNQLSK